MPVIDRVSQRFAKSAALIRKAIAAGCRFSSKRGAGAFCARLVDRLVAERGERLDAGGPLMESWWAMPPRAAVDNERVIRRLYEALNADDLEAGIELTAPDIELETRFTSLAGRPYRGHEGVAQWAADVNESWEDMKQTPERFVALDSQRTIVVARVQARGRGSGVHVDQTLASIITVDAGKVTRVEGYPTLEEALRAAGQQR
jgi:ketosteroid isomerase-like protein